MQQGIHKGQMFEGQGVDRRSWLKATTGFIISAACASDARAQDLPRAMAPGQKLQDRRLGELKNLNGYFPFAVPATPDEWERRAEQVRRQVLVACGLWPMPPRPPVHAVIHGKIDRDEYTIEKVYFESFPGLYVTGNLYRPKISRGKLPAVICPHGHWGNGRFHDHGEAKVKQEIELGAEKFPRGGRHPLQARCVHLARMGYVAFLYDMLGYADNQVLPASLIHGFARQRPEMSQPDRWGLFSAQAELRCLNALGLQTWNSLRVVDWITTLPDVDPQRIGVTGASGGGTQTFLLAIVDDRPQAFFPAVMVSTAMQGGCTCENASYLRIGSGNIEFAAMVAPRYLGMTAANDWTRELETKGLPELKQLFALLGVPDRVEGRYFPFEHNYNYPSRAMMYAFMQRALMRSHEVPEERDFLPLTPAEATVWNEQHPPPPQGEDAELKILRGFDGEFQRQWQSLSPHDQSSWQQFRQIMGGGWEVMVGRNWERRGQADLYMGDERTYDGLRIRTGIIKNSTYQEEVPGLFILPESWNHEVVLWLTDRGKAGLFLNSGQVPTVMKQLVNTGYVIVGLDLFDQGEFTEQGEEATYARRVPGSREFVGYTLGYNHPLCAQRVHDVLSLFAAAERYESPPERIHVVAVGKVASIAAATAFVQPPRLGKLALHAGGFRFRGVVDWRDPWLWPGALRYGDLSGLISLSPHVPLWWGDAQPEEIEFVSKVRQAAGMMQPFTGTLVAPSQRDSAIVSWLLS